MLRRLRRAAALVFVAQLAVVGVRVASASCVGACDMQQDVTQKTLDGTAQMASMPDMPGMTTSMDAPAMPMASHHAPPADDPSHDGSDHGTAPTAPDSCLAGANCAPPLAIIAIASLERPTSVVPHPASMVASMLTRAAAAPEAPPPKA